MLLVCATVLLPWIAYLSLTLGSGDYLVRRWGVAWCGLDAAEVVGLVATGLLVRRRSPLASMIAAATATLFLVDAWFDTVTARIGMDYLESLVIGLVAELPLSVLCAIVAWRTAHWRPSTRSPRH